MLSKMFYSFVLRQQEWLALVLAIIVIYNGEEYAVLIYLALISYYLNQGWSS